MCRAIAPNSQIWGTNLGHKYVLDCTAKCGSKDDTNKGRLVRTLVHLSAGMIMCSSSWMCSRKHWKHIWQEGRQQ